MVFTRFVPTGDGHFAKLKMKKPIWPPSFLSPKQGGHMLGTINELPEPDQKPISQIVGGRRRTPVSLDTYRNPNSIDWSFQ